MGPIAQLLDHGLIALYEGRSTHHHYQQYADVRGWFIGLATLRVLQLEKQSTGVRDIEAIL